MPQEKNKIKSKKNLFELLGELKDYRRKQGTRHPLQVILLLAIMAVTNGAKGYTAMGEFVKNNKKELIKLLKLKKKRLPSKSTFERALKSLDFETFSKMFSVWSLSYVTIKTKEWLSVDGKAIGGTVTNPNDICQSFVSLVSVFASKQKQVLQAGKINNKKESEIPMVKELIQMLDLEGVVFTIDALHCQKETTKTIINSKNNYVIGVKGNQPKLHEQIKKL